MSAMDSVHHSRRALLCKDCRHLGTVAERPSRSVCNHPGSPVSAVTGLPFVKTEDMRADHKDAVKALVHFPLCGPEGLLFERNTACATCAGRGRLRHCFDAHPTACPDCSKPASNWDDSTSTDWLAVLDELEGLTGRDVLFWPDLGAPAHAAQAEHVHQSGAHAVGAAAEDDQLVGADAGECLKHPLAGGALGKNFHGVQRHALGALTVLGVVVRSGEVHRLLPDLCQLLEAVRRLHDGGDVTPVVSEGVEHEVERPHGAVRNGADDPHALPLVVLSEASVPVMGLPGETAWIDASRLPTRNWAPWYAHAVLINALNEAPAESGATVAGVAP